MSTDFMHISPSNLNNGSFRIENSKKESKPNNEAKFAADDKLQKCYNPAFCGLFKQGGYDSSKDLRVAFSDVVMPPFKDFIVDENSEITGKNKLRFKKDNEGYLHAMNIAPCFSDYPVLKQNAVYVSKGRDILLLPDVRYAVRNEAKLRAGDFELDIKDYPQILNLPENEKIIIGSSDDADIKPEGSYGKIAGRQWQIEKKADYYLISDLTKEGGTILHNREGEFTKEYNPDFMCDFPESKVFLENGPSQLKSLRPAIVPSDSIILLGQEYPIDLKDRELLEKFKYKDTIIIGTGKASDIKINDSYSYVSSRHVAVKKCKGFFVVCDLGSINGTEDHPRNSLGPFLRGVDKTHLGQGDIGDCYLLAPLYALSRNEKGAEILENMVKEDNEGNYLVKFKNSPTFIIRPNDFTPDRYRNELKEGVSGDPAIRAIERAYARYVKPVCVLGGKRDREMFSKIDDGGTSSMTLLKLTGKKPKTFSPEVYSSENLIQELSDLKAKNCVLTASSRNSTKHYLDSCKTIVRSHVYVLDDVFPDEKRVSLINPHDTKHPVYLDIDTFQKYFSSIDALDLN